MAIFGKSTSPNNRQTTIIAAGSSIKGDLMLSSMIYIDGRVEGNIVSNTNSVVIGKNGSVTGNISAQKVVINGNLEGNVDANSIEILSGALFKGDMEVCDLTCEPGGKFVGHCTYREHKKDEILMLNNKKEQVIEDGIVEEADETTDNNKKNDENLKQTKRTRHH